MERPQADAILAHLPHYLYVYDLDGGASHFFGRHLGLDLGYSQAELDAMGPEFLGELLHPDDQAHLPGLLARWETARDDQILETEHRLRHRDGSWRWYLGRDRVFERDAQGRVQRIIGTSFDITTRKSLEARVIADQRLDALTLLAGGVAHDLNNMLTAVFGQVELVRLARDEAGRREELAQLEGAARSASELVSKLLTFARRSELVLQPVEVDPLVGGILRVMRSSLGPSVRLEVTLAAPGAAVEADSTQLEQVVMNLVLNARDAMPAGGRLRVATQRLTLSPGDPGLRADMTPGRYVRLLVQDEGPGIPPALRARVFEPFFTTKADGTGLGLATLYGIVRQGGGHVHVGASDAGGAAFHVDLPELHAGEQPPALAHVASGCAGPT